MFEDFSFCTECEHYDQNDRLCKLFQCVRVNGCQCGEERKPRNNFEAVKALSMEGMAVWLASIGPMPETMLKFWRYWLKKEVGAKTDWKWHMEDMDGKAD